MSLDIVLAAALGLVQVATAFWGVYVTLHPPSPTSQRCHTVAFWLLGIVGIILIIAQAYRADSTQKAVQAQLTRIRSGIDKLVLGTKPPSPARVLTESDQKRLIEALKPFATSSVKVTVGCLAADGPGPCKYAQQWKEIFERATWRVTGRLLPQLYVPPFAGVQIAVSSESTPGAGLIQQAFKSVGVDAGGVLDKAVAADEILIKVGADN